MTAIAVRAALPPSPVIRSVEYYVPLPRRLAEDLRNSPVAIGAYCLIARLYRISRAPVPLSPGDLQCLDPSLSYGAATRALRRLADSPYVLVERVRGRKNSYAPAWGAVSGAVLPWDLGAPCLGRPRHIAELRLDQRLFDTCLGHVRTHAEHPAIVERYVAQPLLGLEEVGAYGAALAGVAPAGGRLVELGLLDHCGRPLREIGVRRSVSERMGVRPQEQIAQVIAQARARGDVRDLAGWVVSALHELPESQPVGPPRPKASDRAILMHPELTHAERSRWLTRFRNADATARSAVLERFIKEHPHEQFV